MTWEEQTIGSLEWSEKNIKKLDRSRQSSLALFIASPQLRILYVMNLIYFGRKTDIFMFKLAVSNSFFVKKTGRKAHLFSMSGCKLFSVSLFSFSRATALFICHFCFWLLFLCYYFIYFLPIELLILYFSSHVTTGIRKLFFWYWNLEYLFFTRLNVLVSSWMFCLLSCSRLLYCNF